MNEPDEYPSAIERMEMMMRGAETESPITRREGIKMLNELSLIEYALEAVVCSDQGGPLTSSPTQRRNVANTLRGLASQFEALADVVDPLMDGKPPYQLRVDGFEVGDRVKVEHWTDVMRIVQLEETGWAKLKPEDGTDYELQGDLTSLGAIKLKSIPPKTEPADGEDTTSTPPAGA